MPVEEKNYTFSSYSGQLLVGTPVTQTTTATPLTSFEHVTGQKAYELSNHLGNVLAVVSDARQPINGSGSLSGVVISYSAMVVSATDYSAFGAPMAGRQYSSTSYRYGFNGKENDPEANSTGNGTQDYGFRIYNPSLGKFFSVDPLKAKYAFYSPYAFAGNSPVACKDLDGLEQEYIPSKFTGSGNVMIILMDSPTTQLSAANQAELALSTWDYICVNTLEEGNVWLHENYADGSVNNLIIQTHGTGVCGGDGNAICAKDYSGNLETNPSDRLPVTAQDFKTADKIETPPSGVTISSGTTECANPTSPEGVQNAKAIKGMSTSLSQGATVLFMGCGLGKYSDLDQAIFTTMDGKEKELTMYFNKGTTEFYYNPNVTPNTEGVVLDEPLSDQFDRRGWAQYGTCYITEGQCPGDAYDIQINSDNSSGPLIQPVSEPVSCQE